MFILDSDGANSDIVGAFSRYREYIDRHEKSLPAGVLAVVRSDWYFDFNSHRCPHDAWLMSATLDHGDPRSKASRRNATIRLLGAYHDMVLTFRYLDIGRWTVEMPSEETPLDFHRDEFLLGPSGKCTHTIEWANSKRGPTWVIEAREIMFTTEPAPGSL